MSCQAQQVWLVISLRTVTVEQPPPPRRTPVTLCHLIDGVFLSASEHLRGPAAKRGTGSRSPNFKPKIGRNLVRASRARALCRAMHSNPLPVPSSRPCLHHRHRVSPMTALCGAQASKMRTMILAAFAVTGTLAGKQSIHAGAQIDYSRFPPGNGYHGPDGRSTTRAPLFPVTTAMPLPA